MIMCSIVASAKAVKMPHCLTNNLLEGIVVAS